MNRNAATPLLLLPLLLLGLAGCGGDDAADSRAGEATRSAPTATQASRSETDAALEEMADYRLNMPDVERWHEAQRDFYRRVEDDPELAREVAEMDLTDATSIDEMEDLIAGQPTILETIEDAGLEPREFVLILFGLYQATVADAMIQTGTDPDAIMAETDLHPDNLEFVRENRARLEELQEETDALLPPELEDGFMGG